MDDLYGERCRRCHGHADSRMQGAAVSFEFTRELMAKVLRDIFYRTFDVKTEIDEDLFLATVRTFGRAAEEGFGQSDNDRLEEVFLEQIRDNLDVFSAFRTHRMQNDIASQLLDEKGKLKPFSRFQEDVQAIIGTYNTAWLETEYDTAVLRARQAADWKLFDRDADILPNLRWLPTTSAEPDPVHAQFWGIDLTLPKGHGFWKSHRPGDRWNCKCSLEQTDDKPTPGGGRKAVQRHASLYRPCVSFGGKNRKGLYGKEKKMNVNDAVRELRRKEKEIKKAFSRTLPRRIGAKAVNLVNRNFREGGFYDGGLHPWKRTRRQDSAKGAAGEYGPLLSRRNRLSRSSEYEAEPYKVTIRNTVEYAGIHNYGGRMTTHPRVTAKMRKMAWRMYFKEAGITKRMGKKARRQKAEAAPPEALKWKAMALTRKQRLDVKADMPRRQFIGPSRELREMTRKETEKEITNILLK